MQVGSYLHLKDSGGGGCRSEDRINRDFINRVETMQAEGHLHKEGGGL